MALVVSKAYLDNGQIPMISTITPSLRQAQKQEYKMQTCLPASQFQRIISVLASFALLPPNISLEIFSPNLMLASQTPLERNCSRSCLGDTSFARRSFMGLSLPRYVNLSHSQNPRSPREQARVTENVTPAALMANVNADSR